MIGDFKRFDVARRPNRQWRILMPVTWLISFPKAWLHRARIDKTGLPKDLKPPYFLLCNHNSFMDFMIMTKAIFPRRANYVVAIDGFIGIEWLLRAVGGIGNRKFVRSFSLVKNMLHARGNGDVVVLFPEARYSLCGTSAVLPASLGKMARKMNVPVVTLIMHGHHINSPFWNVGSRKVKPVTSEMKLLFTAEETQSLPVDELNRRMAKAFVYDDYAWQKAPVKPNTKCFPTAAHSNAAIAINRGI
jgi:1-acyl-sn-glycerol-3-phosphate acyltransferase